MDEEEIKKEIEKLDIRISRGIFSCEESRDDFINRKELLEARLKGIQQCRKESNEEKDKEIRQLKLICDALSKKLQQCRTQQKIEDIEEFKKMIDKLRFEWLGENQKDRLVAHVIHDLEELKSQLQKEKSLTSQEKTQNG